MTRRVVGPMALLFAALAAAAACAGSGGEDGADPDGRGPGGADAGDGAAVPWTGWQPSVATTWQWQLRGTLDRSVEADVYDIDLFDTPQGDIEALHAAGRRVVCYFSAGSSEDWREDFGRFRPEELGNPLDGWEGERWLDVRSENVRAVMAARLDRAVEKGCDGVEPDNVDGWENDPGFPLTRADQLAFARWLADEAHRRGLAVGLKNALDLVPELVDRFEFQVNEQCHEFDECEALQPFVAAGKPVWNAEYAAHPAAAAALAETVCPRARAAGLRTLILPLELDGRFRVSCDRVGDQL